MKTLRKDMTISLFGLIITLILQQFAQAQRLDSLSAESLRNSQNDPNSNPKKVNQRKITDEQLIEELKKTIQTSPENASLHNNLGVVYTRLRKYDEAYIELKKALKLAPNQGETNYNLSVVAGMLERFPEALEYIKKAWALNFQTTDVKLQYCELLMFTKQSKKSVACYEELPNLSKINADTKLLYILALLKAEKIKKAQRVYEENESLFLQNAPAQTVYGMILYRKKEFRTAIDHFSRALKINSTYDPARFNLALSQIRLNDKPAALNQYNYLKNSNSELANKLYRFIYGDKIVFVGK